MMKRVGTLQTLLLSGALIAVPACSVPADEQALRDTLSAMHDAVEARDSDQFLDSVAENFAGEGGMDRDGLRRLLVLQFLRNQQIGATLGPPSIRIEGERAQAEFVVVLTGSTGGLIPERADGYRVTTGWRVESGAWVVEYAEWE